MKWISLIIPITILLNCVTLVNFIKWQNVALNDIQQRQLDMQVNYAVDAAMQDVLDTSIQLEADYGDYKAMTVEPEIALQTYTAVLLRNFGWSESDRNAQDLLESSMPFFMVAAYDGYYVYYKQEVHRDITLKDSSVQEYVGYNLMWTPKLPYSTPVNSEGTEYRFYNLGDRLYNVAKIKADGSLEIIDDAVHSDATIADKNTVVANKLEDAANSALFTGLHGDSNNDIVIPSSYSKWSENHPIQSPSIITYVNNPFQLPNMEVQSFGVGGSKIDEPEWVILYKVTDVKGNEIKTYTWSENREDVESRGLTITSILSSSKEAAERGYWLDPVYMYNSYE